MCVAEHNINQSREVDIKQCMNIKMYVEAHILNITFVEF